VVKECALPRPDEDRDRSQKEFFAENLDYRPWPAAAVLSYNREMTTEPDRGPLAESGGAGTSRSSGRLGQFPRRRWGPSPREPLLTAGLCLFAAIGTLPFIGEHPERRFNAALFGVITVVFLVRAEVLRRRAK
jgi:hypothetical protein